MSKAKAIEENTADEAEDNKGITEAKGRPTPGRRQKSKGGKNAPEGNAITRPVNGFVDYLRDVKSEVDKVTWPSREDVIRLTRIVLLVTIAASIALGIVSVILTEIFTLGLSNPIIIIGMLVLMVAVAGYFLWRSSQSGASY